jgi:ribosomal protein L37AE/L43A
MQLSCLCGVAVDQAADSFSCTSCASTKMLYGVKSGKWLCIHRCRGEVPSSVNTPLATAAVIKQMS